jgi:hypothetical protein
MGMLINMPIGSKVIVEYEDLKENCEGVIVGKITNIFKGFVDSNLDLGEKEVAGIYVEKWIENGKELEIKRHINDKTNIYKQDIVSMVE